MLQSLFLRSLNEQIPLEIIYLSADHELSQRKLIVKEVNDGYIRAYCLLRRQMRTFRVDHILSAMPESHSKYRLH